MFHSSNHACACVCVCMQKSRHMQSLREEKGHAAPSIMDLFGRAYGDKHLQTYASGKLPKSKYYRNNLPAMLRWRCGECDAVIPSAPVDPDGRRRRHNRCARCLLVRYCDRACQKKHWTRGHQTLCTMVSTAVSLPMKQAAEEAVVDEITSNLAYATNGYVSEIVD